MATLTKQCNQCGKNKPTSAFHKRAASIDGLQHKCKSCVKEINQNFRKEKPQYQIQWQRANKETWYPYIREWNKVNVNKSDDRSQIYTITSPSGNVYVGMTQTKFHKRVSGHKTQYKRKVNLLPLLHQSFDEFGFDNHKFEVINLSGFDIDTLKILEATMINEFKNKGISLNKRIN